MPIPKRLALLAALIATPALAAPVAISVHDGWGAFRDGKRCYAISEARSSSGGKELEPFASVSLAPGAPAVQLRLSRVVKSGSAVTLDVGERRFRLSAQGATATSRDVAAGGSAAVIAAMRASDTMTVGGRDRRNRFFRDSYSLIGAPTAIDSAIVACGFSARKG